MTSSRCPNIEKMTEEQEQPGQDANGGADKVCCVSMGLVRLGLMRSVRLGFVRSVCLGFVRSVRLVLVRSVRLGFVRSMRFGFMMPVMVVAHFKTARDQ